MWIIPWKNFNKFKRPKQLEKRFCCFDDGPIKAITKYQDGLAFIYDGDDYDPAKVYYMYPSEESYFYEDLDIPIPIKFEEMIFDNDGYLVGIKIKLYIHKRMHFIQ